MDEKERLNPTDIDAVPAGGDEGEAPVYDIDVEPADAQSESDDASAEDAGGAARPGRRVSRKDILNRFQEKNEVIVRLTRDKTRLEKENTELADQVREHKDRWLRAAAEFENYRKRTAREWELLKQQSKSEVILEVLNSLDDFERAFAVVEGAQESEFVQGIRLIYNNLLTALQKLGVTELDAHHKPFDPNVHMAIGQVETDEVESGHVAQVVGKGYSLNGALIRPARVVVAK
ncbi:MAG TPA: nucleotide exchange factor GrpE [Candidatus Krumholzibacteria bacterium]|nr:nucleotide exchange factor GrpE [Candidatus Krumholzibacteria bacterium]